MGKYSDIIISVYRNCKNEVDESTDNIEFSSQDIKIAIRNSKYDHVRVSDLVYYYNYRSELPASIKKDGFVSIKQHKKSGNESIYKFTKDSKSIKLNNISDLKTVSVPSEKFDKKKVKYWSEDEQSILARIRDAKILEYILENKIIHLQSHYKTEDELSRIEVDDLYIIDEESDGVLMLEAKNESDTLNLDQIRKNTKVLYNSNCLPDLVQPIGVQIVPPGVVYVGLFSKQSNEPIEICLEEVYRIKFEDILPESYFDTDQKGISNYL